MSVNSAVVRFGWDHEKNKWSEGDFKTNFESVENKERSHTLKKMPTWSKMIIATLGELTIKEIVQCGS